MVAPKDEKVRIVLFKIYFGLFQNIVSAKEQPNKSDKKVKQKNRWKNNGK